MGLPYANCTYVIVNRFGVELVLRVHYSHAVATSVDFSRRVERCVAQQEEEIAGYSRAPVWSEKSVEEDRVFRGDLGPKFDPFSMAVLNECLVQAQFNFDR